MKRFYQLLMTIFVGLAVVSCGDNTNFAQDLTAFDQATAQNGNLAEIQKLQVDLQQATTPEMQSAVFSQIAEKYKTIKDNVAALEVETDDGKEIQKAFVSGFDDFIQLMQLSAKYTIEKPTEEEGKVLLELQQQATQKLTQATQLVEALKAKVEEKK